jgi:hypothetical protein
MFAGDDPLTAIAQLVGAYWSRREQKTLLSILRGVFGSALTDNELDDSANILDNGMMVDALGVLGDASEKITGILMHSAVQSHLAKNKLLDPKPTEPGTQDRPEFDRFLGRRVIVDDGAPMSGGVYTTYFFGQGSIGFAAGSPSVPVAVERSEVRSLEILVHRRQFIMHPRGLAWVGNASNDTPSNTELANPANWERVFELKNIPIVALKHRIG